MTYSDILTTVSKDADNLSNTINKLDLKDIYRFLIHQLENIFLKHGRVIKIDVLGQDSANLFCDGSDSKYFRFCGPGAKIEDII